MAPISLDDLQPMGRRFPVRFDFHLHTSWTDGAQSSAEMYEAAVRADMQYILFSEHARKSSGDWFGRFADDIRALPKFPCRALVGVEAKVENFEGDLDTTPEIVAATDLVMASVHRFLGEKGQVQGFDEVNPSDAVEIESLLTLAVLDNPAVDILGHPFGMSYGRFKTPPPPDKMLQVIEKAARVGVAIEVNSHYHPDPWQLIEWCQSAGATISLGSNAHDCATVGKIVRVLAGEAS